MICLCIFFLYALIVLQTITTLTVGTQFNIKKLLRYALSENTLTWVRLGGGGVYDSQNGNIKKVPGYFLRQN